MKKFSDYKEHIESQRRKSEEEMSKMLDEKNENIFFKRNITPALKRIAEENSSFQYEQTNYGETANTVTHEYRIIVDEAEYHETLYNLTIKIDGDERYNGVEITLENDGSGHQVEAIHNHKEIDKNSFEEILTDLLIRLYDMESE